jgi:hypothetical protein
VEPDSLQNVAIRVASPRCRPWLRGGKAQPIGDGGRVAAIVGGGWLEKANRRRLFKKK